MAPMTITATAKSGERVERTVYTVGQLMQFLHRLGIPIAAELLRAASLDGAHVTQQDAA